MFGYLTVHKPELKFKEFEAYKAVYCTLCKNIRKNYGLISSFALNYECTFLALFDLGIDKSCPNFEKCRCTVNPLKKCNKCVGADDKFDFASAVTIILTYYKLLDAVEDSGFLKSIAYRFAKMLFKRKFKIASKKYPAVENIARIYIDEQNKIEKDNNTSVDVAADPTANMLKALFAELDMTNNDKLSRFGYCIGRWIYLIDALDDIDDDLKTGSFNVFLANANGRNINELKQYAFGVLNFTLGEAISALEDIEIYHFRSIIYNIVRDGMSNVQENAKTKARKKNEKSI